MLLRERQLLLRRSLVIRGVSRLLKGRRVLTTQVVVILLLALLHRVVEPPNIALELTVFARGRPDWMHFPHELVVSILLKSFLPLHLKPLPLLILDFEVFFEDRANEW